MPRRRMAVANLSESTKRNKFSQSQLEEREKQEKEIVELFNDGFEDIRDFNEAGLDNSQKLFYRAIKKVLEKQGTYTNYDTTKMRSLAISYWVVRQAEDMILKDPFNSIIASQHKSYIRIVKELEVELQISLSERQKLRETTLDGEFLDTPSEEEVTSLLAQYYGGNN
ncbi:hypothetical protein [Clostridium sp. UBA4548]|uniref:hypothetical protein n=1 Tax=Clostridium sp. UBA4548 TaxID=1946361 RepID=UPI0025BA4EBE|nr:hypothetical protein [Clostridium sp. UBA4548]